MSHSGLPSLHTGAFGAEPPSLAWPPWAWWATWRSLVSAHLMQYLLDAPWGHQPLAESWGLSEG